MRLSLNRPRAALTVRAKGYAVLAGMSIQRATWGMYTWRRLIRSSRGHLEQSSTHMDVSQLNY